jgi:hypothetical protein
MYILAFCQYRLATADYALKRNKVGGKRNNISGFEGSEAVPASPSDKSEA